MKLILKSEVDNLGLPGDVVDVADGYGRNFLIPRGMAILATVGAMKEADALTRSRKAREAKTVDSAAKYKEALESRALRIGARVDDRGSLYGSVTAVDVQRVLKERGHDIERKRIELRGSIKEIGTYEIPVRVHPQVTATVTVEVVDAEGVVTRGSIAAADDAADAPTDVLTGEATGTGATDALTEQALEAAEQLDQLEGEPEPEETLPTPDAAEPEAG
jgi:large subunit ribosomal protein L9